MTVVAEEGLAVLEQLMKVTYIPTMEIVKMADSLFNPIRTAIILAGRNENNRLFIWSKNPEGTTLYLSDPDNVHYIVSSNEKNVLYSNYFKDRLYETTIDKAIENTIKFASIDDKTINDKVDLHRIR